MSDVSSARQVTLSVARTDVDLEQILALQRRYLRGARPVDEENAQGFVYVQHTLPVLRRMAAELPQAVALAGGQVVGYCLSLPVSLRPELPRLEPMFAEFDRCRYAGRPLTSYRFYVGGQVCVEAAYRGRGLLGRLYDTARRALPSPHELCVTEIATRNAVSIRAHERLGFRRVSTYADGHEEWVVVAWPLSDAASGSG